MLEPMTYSTQGKHTNHYTTDTVTVIYTKDRKCEKYIKLKYQFELLIPQLSNHLIVPIPNWLANSDFEEYIWHAGICNLVKIEVSWSYLPYDKKCLSLCGILKEKTVKWFDNCGISNSNCFVLDQQA
jgi:hypothetical protein